MVIRLLELDRTKGNEPPIVRVNTVEGDSILETAYSKRLVHLSNGKLTVCDNIFLIVLLLKGTTIMWAIPRLRVTSLTIPVVRCMQQEVRSAPSKRLVLRAHHNSGADNERIRWWWYVRKGIRRRNNRSE